MKHLRTYLFISSFLLAMTGCSDNTKTEEPTPEPTPEQPEQEITEATVDEKAEMQTLKLSGLIKDPQGNLLPNVTVTSGDITTQTNAAGIFRLDKAGIVAQRTVLHFSKEGFFNITRALEKEENGSWEIIMYPKGNNENSVSTSFTSTTATQLNAGKMKIEMPGDGYKVADTGKPYSGTIQADIIYLDPTSPAFATAMPGGDLAAIRQDYSNVSLVSYGIVGVNLSTNDGQQIQLADNATATLVYPIPEGMDNNLPQSIPLWYFNEKAGLWIESGVAERNGNEYTGKVRHFSYYNLDVPQKRAYVRGNVVDCKNRPVAGRKVHVGQTFGITNAEGFYSTTVPSGTELTAEIRSEDYGYYKEVVSHQIPALSGSEICVQNFNLPCLSTISGKIINECNAYAVADVWLEYEGKVCESYQTGTDGLFSISAPENYSGPATLKIQTSDNNTLSTELQLTNEDLDLGLIYVCEDYALGGVLLFSSPDGSTQKYEFIPGQTEGVIRTDDNTLIISSENLLLGISDYSPDKVTYSQVTIFIQDDNENPIMSGEVNANVNYVPENDIYEFYISGESMTSYYPEPIKVEGRININRLYDITTLKNVTSTATLNLPDFAPTVPTPIDWVSHIDGKLMGQGYILD